MIEIKEVISHKELKEFISFPFKIYSKSPIWVPPLIFDEINTLKAEKNPAFEYCEAKYWLAKKNGKTVGRIAGIINHKYVEKWGKKYARFGWIDFIDDIEVSKALMDTVEKWAKDKGLSGVHGPLGFCDMDKEGMLIDGFDEPGMIITIYNYPYYQVHMERLGYQKDADWVEYEIRVPDSIPERIIKINNQVLERLKMKIIKFKRSKEVLAYADEVFGLLNEAYKELYGVIELTDAQIKSYTKQYFGFINPDYVRVILDENSKVAAFGIAIPSLANAFKKARGRLFPFGFYHILKALKRNDRLDLMLVAVKPELQGKGLNAVLLTEINVNAISNGIRFAETGPELEVNKNVQALWKYYETRQHKKRRCYLKHLE